MSLYVQNIWGKYGVSVLFCETDSFTPLSPQLLGRLTGSEFGDMPVSACLLRGAVIDGRQYTQLLLCLLEIWIQVLQLAWQNFSN